MAEYYLFIGMAEYYLFIVDQVAFLLFIPKINNNKTVNYFCISIINFSHRLYRYPIYNIYLMFLCICLYIIALKIL